MRYSYLKYMCFPSVVPIGKETEITIVPRDNSRIFRENKEYTLGIAGLQDDMLAYGDRITKDKPVYIKEGYSLAAEMPDKADTEVRFYGGNERRE